MKDYKIILDMIEAVDPADTAKLDEIDARVEWYLGFYKEPLCSGFAMYTRSRDALKAIRPEGWAFDITVFSTGDGQCEAHKIVRHGNMGSEEHSVFSSFEGHTEELAELHAIIQAIAYERKATTLSNKKPAV